MKTIVFTGGGTGGHIFPGLAVADELRKLFPDADIVWIGSRTKRDGAMVLSNIGIDGKASCARFIGIPSGKLRRYFSLQNFIDFFKIFTGFIAAFITLIRLKPLALFSKGGFVSVPPCFAAKLLGIPVFTHECDFSPGLATMLNARFAKQILLSYDESRQFFAKTAQNKIIITGNPVRPAFYSADPNKGLVLLKFMQKPEKPILLVLGGSSGARQINTLILKNIDWLAARFIVVHQTGLGADYKAALKVAENIPTYRPYDFIYGEMPHLLAAADIVLSRSGANSLWECAEAGKPMLLLPLTGTGTRGDQVENAAWFEKNGAAIVLDSAEQNQEKLFAALCLALEKLSGSALRAQMGKAAAQLARRSADTGGTRRGIRPAEYIAQILYDEVK